ncbi:hypothetical protein TIFTF001_014935 [Ficus carica]|uniref:Uncharacterized protein n=1 Tax=Ficus carica TaxID=3494 RepID=A0AA88ARZ3_FICCA|nr:hypothetical protein TIFTF001_014935 [Ficus carica]
MAVKEEIVSKAFSEAMGAHRSRNEFVEKITSSEAIFSFPGSWSFEDWCSEEAKIDSALFPSLRSLGNKHCAVVNKAFQDRFKLVAENSQLRKRVEEAVQKNKQIVFTGHSSGGPIAVLAAIWFLEDSAKRDPPRRIGPLCLTFGSPLVGNHIFSHALRRENWSRYFIHFATRYDIVPRIFLAPLSSKPQFQQILDSFKSQSVLTNLGSYEPPSIAYEFFKDVMSNALTVTSHAACKLMESSNLLFETMTSFIKPSSYRPFGTYIFSNGNGKLVTLNNADAVLQLLFYSCQPSSEEDGKEIAKKSLTEHFAYNNELLQSLKEPIVLDGKESADACNDMINKAAEDMGLSARGRLCLLAAGELDSQKRKNKEKMDSKKGQIERALKDVENYKNKCAAHKVGYYDSFKRQKNEDDFKANVKRLELAGILDEMIEMLKGYKLPDQFEGLKEWIDIGTRYRRLIEPLDIANYYRHSKDEDTGPYMVGARPKRYRYPQAWREHAEKMPEGSSGESCFWAEVEDLRTLMKKSPEEQTKFKFESRTWDIQNNVVRWGKERVIQDAFFGDSTFVKWWESLPNKLPEIEQLVIR